MKLKSKLFLISLIVTTICSVSFILYNSTVIMDSFNSLESRHMITEGQKVHDRFLNIVSGKKDIVTDWATWDDVYYNLYSLQDDVFSDSELESIFENSHVTHVLAYNIYDKPAFNRAYNRESKSFEDVDQKLINDLAVVSVGDGIIIHEGRTYSYSKRKILDSRSELPPKGYLVFTSLIDQDVIKYMAKELQININMIENLKVIKNYPKYEKFKAYNIVEVAFPYENDDSFMLLRVSLSKDIYELGTSTTYRVTLWSVGMFVVFIFLFILSVDLIIVNRINRLNSEVMEIGRHEYNKKRTTVDKSDEISGLSWEINNMLDKIEEMNDCMYQYANFDILTGVMNRRAGIEKLEKELIRSKSEDIPLTICFIDVNNLKVVNDILGHIMGDKLLVDLISVISSCIRNTDYIFRIGGDEFLLVFTNSKETDAMHVLERIETALYKENTNEDKPYEMSISYGLVAYDKVLSLDKLVEIADMKMYEDKMKKKAMKSWYKKTYMV